MLIIPEWLRFRQDRDSLTQLGVVATSTVEEGWTLFRIEIESRAGFDLHEYAAPSSCL